MTADPNRRRVLITNDDGIDDPRLHALARAFATHYDTWVVAPAADCSGSGVQLRLKVKAPIVPRTVDLGPGIQALALDGAPGDCVVFALRGLLRDTPPDLVVSGMNRGPNLGPHWPYSGTIGAARLAAMAGIPALALSGDDEGDADAFARAARWSVALADTELVRGLPHGAYLTAGIPWHGPIRGTRLCRRARYQPDAGISFHAEDGGWHYRPAPGPTEVHEEDVAAYAQGYIALTLMAADAHAAPPVVAPVLPHWPNGV